MRRSSYTIGLVTVVGLIVFLTSCPEPETVITIKPPDPNLELGSSLALTVVSSDPEDDLFSWDSDNIACAMVDSEGRVDGLQLGTATITAKAAHSGGIGATTVTVVAPAGFDDDLPRV